MGRLTFCMLPPHTHAARRGTLQPDARARGGGAYAGELARKVLKDSHAAARGCMWWWWVVVRSLVLHIDYTPSLSTHAARRCTVQHAARCRWPRPRIGEWMVLFSNLIGT